MSELARGDIVLAELDPVRGHEAGKTRPVLIVSNSSVTQAASRLGRGVVTVVPLTSTVERIWAHQVRVPPGASGLSNESKLQIEQIRAIDVRRVVRPIGALNRELMAEVDEALRFHLSI